MSSSSPAYSTETPPASPRRVAAATKAARRPTSPAAPAIPGRQIAAKTTAALTQMLTEPSLPGIEITLELMTPELAEHYLAKRPTAQSKIKQRSESSKTVDRYTGDMLAGEWPFTGDPARFNTLGEMIDGQHRLMAIIRSGIAQWMIVVRGLEPETFVVLDTGRARSFTDALRSMGVANVSIVAGISRRMFYWRRGLYGVANVARIPNAPYVGVPASATMLLDVFEEFRHEISVASRRGNAFKQHGFAVKTAAPAVVGFVYLTLSRIDLERCERFFHELQFGPSQVGPEYPIFVLRERLKKRIPDHVAAAPDWTWIHFFFYVWNKWCAGETTGPLKTPPEARFNFVAKPFDPKADERPEGWEPLGGVAG